MKKIKIKILIVIITFFIGRLTSPKRVETKFVSIVDQHAISKAVEKEKIKFQEQLKKVELIYKVKTKDKSETLKILANETERIKSAEILKFNEMNSKSRSIVKIDSDTTLKRFYFNVSTYAQSQISKNFLQGSLNHNYAYFLSTGVGFKVSENFFAEINSNFNITQNNNHFFKVKLIYQVRF